MMDNSNKIQHVIEHPPVDIENGVSRTPLQYETWHPKDGVTSETGVIVFIDGFGAKGRADYAEMLKRYLSTKHNCIVLTVEYFGSHTAPPQPFPNFYEKLKEKHAIEINPVDQMSEQDMLYRVLEMLPEHGVTRLHPECGVFSRYMDEYESMGFLPAIDHLKALQELCRNYNIDKSRIFALGSSYGAYVVMLMAKFAPNTIKMVVENSGFVKAHEETLLRRNPNIAKFGKLTLSTYSPTNWSDNADEGRYFDQHHRLIRDLTIQTDEKKNSGYFYMYHSSEDELVPIEEKQKLATILGKTNHVKLHTITQENIDGRVFKHTQHGMGASLKDIFDQSMSEYLSESVAKKDYTDFDLSSVLKFETGEFFYEFSFCDVKGFQVQLLKN